MKNIIRLGDASSHGGVVLEAFLQTDLNGKPIAGRKGTDLFFRPGNQ